MFSTEIRYAVVRYMLNELGDEAANVGIIAIVDDPPKLLIRFMPDPTIKSRGDAKVSKDSIARFSGLVNTELAHLEAATSSNSLSDRAFTRLSDIGGNLVRLSAPRSVLTNDINREFELLYGQLIMPAVSPQKREVGSRDPLGGLRREASGVITKSVRGALSSQFRKKGFKPAHEVKGQKHTSVFDAVVVTKSGRQSREHLFHHVLLLPDAEESFNQAASLLWKWQDVREKNGKDRELTAVLFARPGARREGVEEAKNVLKKDRVQVAEVAQLPRLVRRLEPQLELAEV